MFYLFSQRARLAADAELDEFEGKTEEEIREIMEEREERSNAQILEMVRMSVLGKKHSVNKIFATA